MRTLKSPVAAGHRTPGTLLDSQGHTFSTFQLLIVYPVHVRSWAGEERRGVGEKKSFCKDMFRKMKS